MNNNRDTHDVIPLPDPVTQPGPTSTAAFRRVRRRKRLTAAALIVGSGAAAVTLAYDLMPATTPVAGTVPGASGIGTSAVTNSHGGPQVAHTVATTSASGVTTTTTTRIVNGHTVVSKSTNAPPYHDN
jgi:hypothetical protein